MSEQTDRFRPFAHLQGGNVALYRAIMAVFVRQKVTYAIHLRPEDVCDGLRRDIDEATRSKNSLDDVNAALRQLVDWGNLRADPDTSRVTTVEDFHRARFLYQLTRDGEAVEVALAEFDIALGRRGELQSVALADITAALRELSLYAEEAAPDPAKVHLALTSLSARFTGLADNAAAFMASLQRTIDLHDVEVDVFLAYKDRLIDYLQRFVEDLVVRRPEIADLIDSLQDGMPQLLDVAAAREASDVAPGAADDTDHDDEGERLAIQRGKAVEWHARWTGLQAWFIGTDDRPSQSTLLLQRARSAIPALLRVVAALHDRRTRRSDRSTDFKTLAVWFAEAEDARDCHRLWRAAFGLSPARHLTVDAATLEQWRDDPVPAATPWAEAPPIVVSPTLRRTGSFTRRGRAPAIEDRSAGRSALRRYADQEAAQIRAARRRLATGRPTRLSELGTLDTHEFALFLSVLGEALAARRHRHGPTSTVSADGSLEVRLEPTDDAAQAELRTPDGTFRGPDHLLTVIDLDPAASDQQEVAS
ncbi:MAG TPA: TIGR02677 family protein [Nocardioidaceae bacterium]|nr:TIGR02677 family protein [Nocardioidaceae bacterium]